ncbi:MAG TPA: aminotransferase class I/II-fold pyridoxal phosphate-dependent enzyme [Opitutaceae bacterium]|nr:aminotransferase class I/II-fold pyridoxal phosphate-dependent enzyme [Opitutaceae bacterium]
MISFPHSTYGFERNARARSVDHPDGRPVVSTPWQEADDLVEQSMLAPQRPDRALLRGALDPNDGRMRPGMDFTFIDYLGLMSHPAVREAARAAGENFAERPADCPPPAPTPQGVTALQAELAEFLQLPHVRLYSLGWSACGGVVGGLIRAGDHVVLDSLVQGSFYEAAAALTRHVHLCRHLDVEHFDEVLRDIRTRESHRPILVVTEALFATEADTADLATLQAVCRRYDALLCVSVANDLGAVGPGGTGCLGLQHMLGQVDLVVGSFFPSLACHGGFVATRWREVRDRLNSYAVKNADSSVLTSVQAATALAALRLARSPEGERRRRALFTAVAAVRAGLALHGGIVLGLAAPMVPLLLGREEVGRMVARLCAERGVQVPLLEHPEVPMGAARLQLHLMATDKSDQCLAATTRIAEAINEAERYDHADLAYVMGT